MNCSSRKLVEKRRLNSPKYKVWFLFFGVFEFLFLFLNAHAGWDLVEALVRATFSAVIVIFMFYFVFLLFLRRTKRKGRFFDEHDSKK